MIPLGSVQRLSAVFVLRCERESVQGVLVLWDNSGMFKGVSFFVMILVVLSSIFIAANTYLWLSKTLILFIFRAGANSKGGVYVTFEYYLCSMFNPSYDSTFMLSVVGGM